MASRMLLEVAQRDGSMKDKKYLVIPDQHAHPEYHNERANWIGELIKETRPDVVVNMGDAADMSSLCSYDKGKKDFQGRTYRKDIDSHLDFQDRIWSTVRKSKKKLPRRIFLHGNHENRIAKTIQIQPELENTISFDDLDLETWYDTIVPYSGGTPGSIILDGIRFAHYLVSGSMGRPIGGEHHAHSLLTKTHYSCVVGHSHLFDHCIRTKGDGKKILGLVAGCYQDYDSSYAGESCLYWSRGLLLLNSVENGVYDLQSISLDKLRKTYGGKRTRSSVA